MIGRYPYSNAIVLAIVDSGNIGREELALPRGYGEGPRMIASWSSISGFPASGLIFRMSGTVAFSPSLGNLGMSPLGKLAAHARVPI
jgi:hypothetical protein